MERISIIIQPGKKQLFLEFLKTLTYVKVEKDDESVISVPGWHDEVVKQRLEAYLSNPADVADFDKTMNELEKGL